jgi:hypothetical protein
MESFEDIQQKEFASLTGELGTLGRRLVEWGWSREQVLAYVKELFTEPPGPTPGDPTASGKEDRGGSPPSM